MTGTGVPAAVPALAAEMTGEQPYPSQDGVVGMRAAAALVSERVGEGTRCTTLRSDPPLALRATADGDSDDASVNLVGSAAGPVGGDELSLSVTVGAGAGLAVRSVAATTVLPGPRGAASQVEVVANVGAGGRLRWLTEPTILVRGCDHHAVAHLRLSPTASLVWREVVILGRHDELPGSLLQRLRVDVDGRPLLRHDLAVGPRWGGSLGPAGVGRDTRAVGTALVVGPEASHLQLPSIQGMRAALLPLTTGPSVVPAVMVNALAGRAGALIALFDGLQV